MAVAIIPTAHKTMIHQLISIPRDYGDGIGDGTPGITMQEMRGKDVENGRVTEKELYFSRFIYAFLDGRAPAEKAAGVSMPGK